MSILNYLKRESQRAASELHLADSCADDGFAEATDDSWLTKLLGHSQSNDTRQNKEPKSPLDVFRRTRDGLTAVTG